MKPKDRMIRTILIAGLALCTGALLTCVVLLLNKQGTNVKHQETVLDGAGIGGPFTLTDTNGKTRTERDFNNTYKIVYFGFTFCPAICPTELQKIAQAYTDLPANIQKQVQMIFISVDPERDTPQAMKNYTALFHPKLIGLTGTEEQVEAAKKAYKVYSAKVGTGNDYSVDHTSFIYFMTPDDKVIALFKIEDSAKTVEEKIEAYFNSKS